jgi:SAM-dependent methyltransferase
MDERSPFAGGDQDYLRSVQYADSANLSARAQLHERYHTASEPWFPWVANRIDWPPAARVLDAGCGTGWLWEETAGLLPADLTLTLSDLSPGMVTEAEEAARGAGLTVVATRVADTQDLPFEDRSFDVAVANHMLYHLPDPDRGVTELARVLDDGGTLLTTTNGPRHLMELNDLRAELFGVDSQDETTAVFGRVSGRAHLEAHFESVRWHDFPDELACTDPDDVVTYLLSAPPGEGADARTRERLRALVLDRFEAGGGTFRITKDTGAFVSRGPRRPAAAEPG